MKKFQAAANAESSHNAPSNVDDVEEHRPESVVVEVTGLLQQQRVSSILGSARFRRQLENVIRGSLSVQQSAPRPQRPVVPPSGSIPPPPPLPTAQNGGEIEFPASPAAVAHNTAMRNTQSDTPPRPQPRPQPRATHRTPSTNHNIPSPPSQPTHQAGNFILDKTAEVRYGMIKNRYEVWPLWVNEPN